MPAAAWALVGALLGLGCILVSQRLFHVVVNARDGASPTYSRWWLILSMAIGGMTGWAAVNAALLRSVALLVVVAALTLVQAPLDFVTRRLSRPVTLLAFGAVLLIWVRVLLESDRSSAVTALAVAIAVVAVYAIFHKLSPQSLGLGDVLLVAPLALALALMSGADILTWQLIASVSGALHAIVGRLTSGGHSIPYGPHLLVAAWLTLVLSV